MKKKKYLLIFLSSLILGLMVTPLRGGYVSIIGLTGFSLATIVGGILFFLLSIFFLKHYNNAIRPIHVILIMLLGCCIFELPLIIIHFKATLGGFPDMLSRLIAILLGYAFYSIYSKICRIILTVCSLSLYLWIAYCGYPLWFHKLSYGSFLGKTEQTITSPVIFQDINGENISLEELGNKYIILDFWSTTCGVCFSQFPEVQKIYDMYKDNTEIGVYSVFCWIDKRGENQQTGVDILRNRGYTYPSLSMDIYDKALEEAGITGFPTVIIFDPEHKMIFRGEIKSAEKLINKLVIRAPML